MILTIRTDSPVAQLAIFDAKKTTVIKEVSPELGRDMARDILGEVEKLLARADTDWHGLTGVVVFQGPGSFTGLRIGATVANTLAYAENIPVVAVQGETWQQTGLARLAKSENDRIVLPHYGSEARITQPRK